MKRVRAYQIYDFKDLKGKSPFRRWVGKLKESKLKVLIAKRLKRISEGNLGDYKPISDQLYELRIHVSPGIRIYFGIDEEVIVVLLYGGEKGSQERDIEKAKGYWKQYLEMEKTRKSK